MDLGNQVGWAKRSAAQQSILNKPHRMTKVVVELLFV